eukprot:8454226-Lingulodinium_polyedra.AAC.1
MELKTANTCFSSVERTISPGNAMGRPLRANARTCLPFKIAEAIVGATRWLAIHNAYFEWAPEMSSACHCWVASLNNVANTRFNTKRARLA